MMHTYKYQEEPKTHINLLDQPMMKQSKDTLFDSNHIFVLREGEFN
jgi:hypothetical protein